MFFSYWIHFTSFPLVSYCIRYYPVKSSNGSLFVVSGVNGRVGVGPSTTNLSSNKYASYFSSKGQVSVDDGSRETQKV